MPDGKVRRSLLPRPVIASWIAVGLAAGGAILSATEPILAPMVLALVTGIVLSPIAVSWERVGIPHRFGALINLVFALFLIGGVLLLLQPVAVRLAEQAPKVASDVEQSLRDLRASLRGLTEMSKDVAEAISLDDPASTVSIVPAAEESAPAESAPVPSVADALWLAPSILARVAVFAGTLFFFLATREDIYRWLSRHIPGRDDSEDIERRLLEAEWRVSRYFLTIAMINAGLGVAVFIVTSQLGVPGAAVWGLLAFLANFVLYLGPACFALALLYAGIAAFDGPMTLLPTACYLGMNFIEGQFVTPALVGRQMQINPLVVFLSVIFGIWLWGPIGGIVAIPIMVWLLVLHDTRPAKEVPPTTADKA
ncbi:AI-2E family transporter [Pseudoruegeria sp. HB172150]|uniref:AI-2E family transporter n=1 Tax=Pseudoruegeria sp. HB172150 TaxID=2721164 RepID=UPI00155193AB|nr:AI-2E family transporter [Pseudoruegeria sp. HB172150]